MGTLRFSASSPVPCNSRGLLGSWGAGNRDLKSGCIYPLVISSFIYKLGLVLFLLLPLLLRWGCGINRLLRWSSSKVRFASPNHGRGGGRSAPRVKVTLQSAGVAVAHTSSEKGRFLLPHLENVFQLWGTAGSDFKNCDGPSWPYLVSWGCLSSASFDLACRWWLEEVLGCCWTSPVVAWSWSTARHFFKYDPEASVDKFYLAHLFTFLSLCPCFPFKCCTTLGKRYWKYTWLKKIKNVWHVTCVLYRVVYFTQMSKEISVTNIVRVCLIRYSTHKYAYL